jgi:predicted Zn-dependent protease
VPRLRSIAALPILLALALGCALNPVTHTPEVVFTTREQEVEVGRQAAREVERTMGTVRDEAMAAYVSEVGARLAARSPRQDVEYHFAVADMEEPNAFALPGGFVFVSWGMLALAQTEDELAGVMGHEIVHVAARHAVQRETAALPVGVLSALGSLAGGIVGGAQLAQLVGGIPELAGGLLLASYGRDQEREADRVGQTLVAEAGWDPAALADVLERMEQVVALETGEERQPSWFDSHPSTPERVESTRERGMKLVRAIEPPLTDGPAAFRARLDGMRVGPDPGEGVFRKELYLHPDMGFAVRFPLGWRTYNSRDAVAALAPKGDAVMALRLHGRGDDAEAAAVAFARENDLTLSDFERVEIRGKSAVRALAGVRTRGTTLVADFTFLAHEGLIYRFTGASPVDVYERRATELISVPESFRDLEESERAFTVRRLRTVAAEPGETLTALGRRVQNAWPADRTAVVNGLDVAAPLAAGTPVRVAVDEPYAPSP